jgi:hypothetical protein
MQQCGAGFQPVMSSNGTLENLPHLFARSRNQARHPINAYMPGVRVLFAFLTLGCSTKTWGVRFWEMARRSWPAVGRG